jgi:CheY-like chemotaxis protein
MPSHTSLRAPLSPQAQSDAFRELCTVYDHFLSPQADPMSEDERLELLTYARVLDVPVDDATDGGDLWRRIRPLLAGQATPQAHIVWAEGSRPTGKVFIPSVQRRECGGGLVDAVAPLSLLVVEDDPDLSAAIIEALDDAGHMVAAAAATAEAAAALAALHAIDFAIVDVELAGDADGVVLAQQLHERWGHKVLFVSGGPNEHLVDLPMALGFVGKPFSAAELLAAVTLSASQIARLRSDGVRLQ